MPKKNANMKSGRAAGKVAAPRARESHEEITTKELEEKLQKFSRIVAQIYRWGGGEQRVRPINSFRDIAEEGYSNPVIAYCVDKIANDSVMLPLEISTDGSEFEPMQMHSHGKANTQLKWLRALMYANPWESCQQQVGAAMRDQLLFGVSYEHAVVVRGESILQELWRIPPADVVPVEGRYGWPRAFEIYGRGVTAAADTRLKVIVDELTARSEMFFLKSYHPTKLTKATAPAHKAYREINSVNEIAEINYQLARNGGVPAGIITTDTDRPQTPKIYEQMQKSVDDRFNSSKNAGRVMVASNTDFKDMATTPREGEYRETRNDMIRDILSQYCMPSQLFGLKDAQTYSNMSEGRRAYFLSAVFPFASFYWSAKSRWLSLLMGRDIAIRVDEKRVPAIADWMADRMVKINGVNFMTIAEKRQMFELPELPDTDHIILGSGDSTLDTIVNPPELPAEDGPPALGEDDDEGGGKKKKPAKKDDE